MIIFIIYRILVWDRPFIFGLKTNNVEMVRLNGGQFENPQVLPTKQAKHLIRLNKGTDALNDRNSKIFQDGENSHIIYLLASL